MPPRKLRRRREVEVVEPVDLGTPSETLASLGLPALDPRTILGLDAGRDPEGEMIAAGAPPVSGVSTLEATARWREAKKAARRAGLPAPPLSDFLPEDVTYHGPDS